MADPYLPEGLPAPAPLPDGLDKPYWEAAARHELVVQHCEHCGAYQWGPEWICHGCLELDPGWAPVSGRGRIYSYERVWHPVHPALRERGAYVVVLVELDDANGARMVGNLLGDAETPVEIGAPVEAAFEDHSDASPPYTLVQWRRVASS